MKNRSLPYLISGISMPLLLVAGPVMAQPASPAFSAPSSAEAGATDKDRIIADLLRRVEALERRLTETNAATPAQAPANMAGPAAAPMQPAAAGERPSASPSASPLAAGTPIASTANEPAEEDTSRALERTLIREGGLVLPPKTFEVEPRLTYDYRSSNALQIVSLGGQPQIASQDFKRDAFEAALGFRVGLPWASQLELSLPYSVNRERRVSAGLDQSSRASGFGDFEIGLTKQILSESRNTPSILGTLRWRNAGRAEDFTNTAAVGSSFRSLLGAVTVVKRQDPMVFYGTLSHTINYSRTIGGSSIAPGDANGLKLGSIFAISPSTSMRFSFDLSRSGENRLDGVRVPGSSATAGLFNTGFSFVLSPKVLLGVEAGVGLTASSPDFRLGVSLPIRF